MQTVSDSQWRKRLSRHTAVKFPFAPLSAKAQPSTFVCRNRTANNCARHRARYRWQLKRSDQHRRTLPCGVTVTQRPLEALFLVRIQAGQPRKRPTASRGCATSKSVKIILQLVTKKATSASALQVSFATLRISLLNIGFVIDQFPRPTMSSCNRCNLVCAVLIAFSNPLSNRCKNRYLRESAERRHKTPR